jgi:hypothetical protein
MDCPTRREGIQSFEFLLTYRRAYVYETSSFLLGDDDVSWGINLKLNDFTDDFVDKSILLSYISVHEVIPIGIFLDAL